MDIGEAVKHLKAGERLRRAVWPEDWFVGLAHGIAVQRQGLPILQVDIWQPPAVDVLATDWIVAEREAAA